MTNISEHGYILILWALIFVSCLMYYRAMIALIISRTISHHTNKASMDWWGLNLGAMNCVVKNPYKKDKKISEYVRKARIVVGIKIISFFVLLILFS